MNQINIEEVRKVVERNFPTLWLPTEACLASLATLLLKKNSNPTALMLNGVSSSGKSTILDFFEGIEGITYRSDYFTPKAFVSHYANKTSEDLRQTDLLPQIKGKVLLISDFGVILGKRKEDKASNLSILTRVLDGKGLATNTGVHGQRIYDGDYMFSMLGGSTPFGYNLWNEIGRFGTRLFFLNMPNVKEDDLEKAVTSEIEYMDKVQECKTAIHNFVRALWDKYGGFRTVDWNNSEIPKDATEALINSAKLVARLRALLEMHGETGGDEELQYKKPTIESPYRALNTLTNIAKGRALIYGRSQIAFEDMRLILEIVLSSCHRHRSDVIRELMLRDGKELFTRDLCELLQTTSKYVQQAINNLKILELVEDGSKSSGGRPENYITLAPELNWLLKSTIKDLFSKNTADIYMN